MSLGTERLRFELPRRGIEDKAASIKVVTADLINNMELFKTNPEQTRCAAIAQTKYEEAAMWAVKAITHTTSTE